MAKTLQTINPFLWFERDRSALSGSNWTAKPSRRVRGGGRFACHEVGAVLD